MPSFLAQMNRASCVYLSLSEAWFQSSGRIYLYLNKSILEVDCCSAAIDSHSSNAAFALLRSLNCKRHHIQIFRTTWPHCDRTSQKLLMAQQPPVPVSWIWCKDLAVGTYF